MANVEYRCDCFEAGADNPGDILREEFLTPLGMSARELADAVRVPVARVSGVAGKRRGITADLALRLGRYFGTTASFWMNLQSSWGLETAD